ncbi:MAG: hypothetical protein K0R54_588 [Clostridiaceae bacterium]|jgi:hypothetical protein|nr:hypothetical protein [Clostridiaceae bacterium]
MHGRETPAKFSWYQQNNILEKNDVANCVAKFILGNILFCIVCTPLY